MTFNRSRLSQAIALACAMGAATAVRAQTVDLGNLDVRGFIIQGANAYDFSGTAVSGAGDVNGDGLADVIVGTRQFTTPGKSYVVFGKDDFDPVDLANLGDGGFRIDGTNIYDLAGATVSGAGDVNGDGLADLLVGAQRASGDGVSSTGMAFVIFGKADTAAVDLTALVSGGFRMTTTVFAASAGFSVSGAGDVNGDGLADVIVAAPYAGTPGAMAGEAYVVFGKSDSSEVDLQALGSGGFGIKGSPAQSFAAYCVSGAGDVNGDGLADVIVGSPLRDDGDVMRAGRATVVFGKANSADVDLSQLDDDGFHILGAQAFDGIGSRATGAGDVNGDGLADVIVGSRYANGAAGQGYVVFGKSDTASVSLASLGDGGFRMDGVNPFDEATLDLAGAGDFNGDGRADLIVGAPSSDNGGAASGSAYLVYGKSDNATVSLGALAGLGFRLDGAEAGDRAGVGVSGAGDVNGDGLADLIIGAREADRGGNNKIGESYVVFSTANLSQTTTHRARSGNGDAARVAIGVSGDGSNDSTPDARLWIDFADGSAAPALASSETVTRSRAPGGFAGALAPTHWRVETTRTGWTSAEVKLRYLMEPGIADKTQVQVVFGPSDSGPFDVLQSVVNPLDNTISTHITQPGVLYLGLANGPPLFSPGSTPFVPEDAGAVVIPNWAVNVNDGDAFLSQDVSFLVESNSNPSLFASAPTLDTNTGTLRFTPAPEASGFADLVLRAVDTGAGQAPNQNTSQGVLASIVVQSLNDAPVFGASDPPPVRNDVAGPVVIPAWAVFAPGAANESDQIAVQYLVDQVSNPALFLSGPTVSTTFNSATLEYTVAPAAFGTSTFRVRVRDSGGTANGGTDLSLPQTFTITVLDTADALFANGFE